MEKIIEKLLVSGTGESVRNKVNQLDEYGQSKACFMKTFKIRIILNKICKCAQCIGIRTTEIQ